MSKLETLLTEFTKTNPFSFFAPASPTSPTASQTPKSRPKSGRSSVEKRRSGKSSRASSLDGDDKLNRSGIGMTRASDGVKPVKGKREGEVEVVKAVLHGPGDLRIGRGILCRPAENEVQIKIACTVLSPADVRAYTSFRAGSQPIVPAHESCGYITALGSAVNRPSSAGGARYTHDQLAIGDLVAIEPSLPCSMCTLCLSGRSNLCPALRTLGTDLDGTLCTHLNHPASFVHKLPSSMSVELGALIHPLAIALHTHTRAKLAAGSTMLVLGAGAIGLLVAAVGKSRGLRVIVADLVEEQVRFATQFGFAEKGVVVPMLPPAKSMDEKLKASQDLAEQIAEVHLSNGSTEEVLGQVDAVFETTGSESALQAGIFATKPGGKVLLMSSQQTHAVQALPIEEAAGREVDLLGVKGYAGTFVDAVGLASSGDPSLPDLERLVMARIKGAKNVAEAFEMGNGEGGKVAFYWE